MLKLLATEFTTAFKGLYLLIFSVFSGLFVGVFQQTTQSRRSGATSKNEEEKPDQKKELMSKPRKSREDFLSIMSHEIRTPLTAIAGTNHLIQDAKTLEESKSHARSMEKSISSLIQLLEDLLDHDLAKSSKLEIIKVEFDLQALLLELIEEAKENAYKNHVKVSADIDPFLPANVSGDDKRIKQTLRNLLNHGIRNSENEVILSAKPVRNADLNEEVEFSVAYEGSEDKSDSLLLDTDQVSKRKESHFDGEELPVAIAKSIVKSLKGQWISKKESGRNVLSFRVSLAKSSAFRESRNAIREDGIPSDLKILVVDDNEMNRIMIGQFLEKWEISYDLAEDGDHALDMISNDHFDLVLLDLQMPRMDGYEFTKMVRTKINMNSTPIIGISADTISNLHVDVTNAGMNDFISKPFKPKELKEKILKHSQNLTS